MQQGINISTNDHPQLQAALHGQTNGQHLHYFESIKNKWNTNQEVADILYVAQSDPQSQCIASHVFPRPSSGTQFIIPRFDGTWFKNDEYIWRRRREGKLVREDHMKLKIHKQQVISANYVHSAIVPTFHRRTYWLTHSPAFVLVHYLNESNVEKGIPAVAQIIAESIKANKLDLTPAQLSDQLIPIYAHCLKPDEVGVLTTAVFDVLREVQPLDRNESSKSKQYQLERRNSCSSAFRKGLSSIALRRQPSANSEIDANYVGAIMKRYGCGGSPNDKSVHCSCGPSTSSANIRVQSVPLDSRSPSGDTEIRSSNMDEDFSVCHQPSVRSSTNGTSSASNIHGNGNLSNHTMLCSTTTVGLTPIIEVSPRSSFLKGGEKILVIGAWYMKGHQYQISFGNAKLVPATLIQAGVLSSIIPSNTEAEIVQIQVFCNGQAVSTLFDFKYEKEEKHEESNKRYETLLQIFEKLRLIAYALNVYNIIEKMTALECDENTLVNLVSQIDSAIVSCPSSVIHFPLISGCDKMQTKSILHLTALLDWDRLFEAIVILGRRISYCREFDMMLRDFEGSTPLHIAAKWSSIRVTRYILSVNPSSVDVLDDRGRTPSDVTNDIRIEDILNSSKNIDGDRHVNATELWVLTNGETVTREHLLLNKLSKTAIDEQNDEQMRDANSSCSILSDVITNDPARLSSHFTTPRPCEDDCDSYGVEDDDNSAQQLHVEISMDTDVHVPDSPKMARLFHAVTSPGAMVTDNARAKMADLARQIIDALPEKIKKSCDVGSLFADEDSLPSSQHLGLTTRHNPMLSHITNLSCNTSADISLYDMVGRESAGTHDFHSNSEAKSSVTAQTDRSHFFSFSHDGRSFASSSTRANTFESDTLDFDKDLGEFFTINVDSSIDPIQKRLANLKFNDDEQRDVYEAAMVIQRAYREYRARNTSRRQEDIERRAALKIQGCYRRYKQFCYFKKLHNAAIVVQKHFRMRKRDDKEACSENVISNVPEHPTLDGQSIRIQIPQTNSLLLREHRAATTIQLAYRGHRKRQAAARKIQNFMRQSRNNSNLIDELHSQFGVTENACPKRRRYVMCAEIGGKRIITKDGGSAVTPSTIAPNAGAKNESGIVVEPPREYRAQNGSDRRGGWFYTNPTPHAPIHPNPHQFTHYQWDQLSEQFYGSGTVA